MPELKKNILNFGYEINFKYEGMLSHSFDRFYVVMKCVLPTVQDLKILTNRNWIQTVVILDVNVCKSEFPTQYIPIIRNFCKKIVPFVYF